MTNLVSVIMSTYNETISMIKSSVFSILNQSYAQIELIVISDNPDRADVNELMNGISSDCHNVIFIQNSSNIGLTSSLNKGLCLARGDYIARMDADDISDKTRIERQVDYLEKHSLDFVGCSVDLIDEGGNCIGEIMVPSTQRRISELIKFANCVLHPTWLLKSEVYRSLKGYREVYACEDYDFILRAINMGFRLGNIESKLLKYRVREDSISGEGEVIQRLTSDYIAKNYRRGRIVSINEIKTYLSSPCFRSDSLKMTKYVNNKNKAIRATSTVESLTLMCPCLLNKYFYLAARNRILQRIWS